MVQTRSEGSATSSLLVMADLPSDRPITNITDEQALRLLEQTDPMGSRRSSSYYSNMARQWWVNAMYYMGFQPHELPIILNDIDPGILMSDASYTANHIMRMLLTNVARKTQNKPVWSVIPLTPDQPDQDGARVAQIILEHAYDHLDMQATSIRLQLWLEIAGTAFRYANWDKQSGTRHRIYLDPTQQQPTPIDHNGLDQGTIQQLEAAGAYHDLQEGDWEHEVLSPFQVIVCPTFSTLDKQPYLRIDRMVPVHEVWNRWPDKAKDMSDNAMFAYGRVDFFARLATVTTRLGQWAGGSEPVEGARLRELWIPPSGQVPEGRTIMAVGQTIVMNEPHVFKAQGMDKVWPVVDYHCIPVPGRFHSMSTCEHLIASQRDYNRGRAQMVAQRDAYVPQWLAPKGALSGQPLRNEFGDVWEYEATHGKPELAPAPPLNQSALQSVEAARQDMQVIAAQSDATQAQNPAGVRSAVALRMLQEADQQVIGPAISSIESGDRRYGELLLQLAWRNMSLPRAIALVGESRQSDIHWFTGTDIRGNTRVRVVPGSAMPRSRAAAMSVVMDMVQMGALNPATSTKDRRLVWKTLELGDTDYAFQLEDATRRRARIENMMIARPSAADDRRVPEVDPDDDQQAHLEEHILFKQTDEYERLPPIRKMIMNAHIQMHHQFVAQMVQATVAMQQASAGPAAGSAPKQPGKASQPAAAAEPEPAMNQ